jgi:hypothetical protein
MAFEIFQVYTLDFVDLLFQLVFWDFQDFQLAFEIFAGIFSSHFGPLQVFKLVFGVLTEILDVHQVVPVGILGFSRFLVGFWDFCSYFEFAFWSFAGF